MAGLRTGRAWRRALLPAAALSLAAAPGAWAAPVIVTLAPGTAPAAHAASHGLAPADVYTAAVTGYAADAPAAAVLRLRQDPAVVSVEADAVIPAEPVPPPEDLPHQGPQILTNEIRRIGAAANPLARIDGVDERVDADVAIIDSGVDRRHPDLNVAALVNCAGRSAEGLDDDLGHGTLVSGLVGALDNDTGVVGVAPGARIWAVRVVNRNGLIRMSYLLCALDWVTRNADVVDVANMSLSGPAEDTGECGRARRDARRDALHRAVCAAVEAGAVVVVSAGNLGADARGLIPASYPEVIAVSAIADTDGAPGGLGTPPPCLPEESDDAFATFSDFGPAVAIAAPGVCITSTLPGGVYGTVSGTSFSAPLVAGAAALVRAMRPDATPAEVREAILAHREPGPIPGDPDGIDEGILNVAELGAEAPGGRSRRRPAGPASSG